jgi:hypothetical protein
LLVAGDTTNSASALVGDANDLALVAMLANWTVARPAGLASGVAAENDAAADALQGYLGDDDFYSSSNDSLGDVRSPLFGLDRCFDV